MPRGAGSACDGGACIVGCGRERVHVRLGCGGRTETRVSGGVNGVKKKGAARSGAGQGKRRSCFRQSCFDIGDDLVRGNPEDERQFSEEDPLGFLESGFVRHEVFLSACA